MLDYFSLTDPTLLEYFRSLQAFPCAPAYPTFPRRCNGQQKAILDKKAFQLNNEELSLEKQGGIGSFLHLLVEPKICQSLLNQCEWGQVLTLRQVCTTTRKLVDDNTIHIRNLKVSSCDEILCIDADGERMIFEEDSGGFVRVQLGEMEYLKPWANLFHQAGRGLAHIIRIPNLKIHKFSIDKDAVEAYDEAIDVVMEHITDPDGIVNDVQVHYLSTNEPTMVEYCEPKHLEVIRIVGVPDNFVKNTHLFFDSDQWLNAKILITNSMFFSTNVVQDFGHFDYADIILDSTRNPNTQIRTEDLVALKDIFLTRPTLSKWEIIPLLRHNQKDPLFTTVPPEFLRFQVKTNFFVFPYSDSNLKLGLIIKETDIVFMGPAFDGNKIEIKNRRLEGMTELIEDYQDYEEDFKMVHGEGSEYLLSFGPEGSQGTERWES